MNTDKSVTSMIKVVCPLSQIKVDNADRVNFLDLTIDTAQLYMLCDGFCCAI